MPQPCDAWTPDADDAAVAVVMAARRVPIASFFRGRFVSRGSFRVGFCRSFVVVFVAMVDLTIQPGGLVPETAKFFSTRHTWTGP